MRGSGEGVVRASYIGRQFAQVANFGHSHAYNGEYTFPPRPKGVILTALGTDRSRGRNSLVREPVVHPQMAVYPMTSPLTHSYRFILNGLVNANQILGEEVFNLADWKAIGEYVYDKEGGRHQAFYSPVKNVTVFGETVRADERIQVEQSLKYSQAEAKTLWNTSSLKEVDQWMLGQEYGKCTHPLSLFIIRSPSFYPRFRNKTFFAFSGSSAGRPATGQGRSDDTPRPHTIFTLKGPVIIPLHIIVCRAVPSPVILV